MYKNLKIAIVVPAYNEEKLVDKTIKSIPDFVDKIVAINDCSKDNTEKILRKLEKVDKRIYVINNEVNIGLGGSMIKALKYLMDTDIDIIGVMAGDAQMDPKYLAPMIDEQIITAADMVKANRFMHSEALKTMPTYRRLGNIFISILTKFATGYYSVFDSQNGYVIYKTDAIRKISLDFIGNRYEYENTMLLALSISRAKVVDFPIPALYGEETSTINLFGTGFRTLNSLNKGFWKRIYYKYILMNFHPIALFLVFGILLLVIGALVGLFIIFWKIAYSISPTTGTVMLCILPVIIGIQYLLTAIAMDVNNENK